MLCRACTLHTLKAGSVSSCSHQSSDWQQHLRGTHREQGVSAFGLQNDCSLSLSLSLTSRGSWQAAAVSCGALQACNGDEDCTAQCCVYDSAVSHPYACDLPLPCALAHGTSFVSQDPMPMTYIPLPSQLLSNSHCQLAWAHSLHLYMPPMLLLYFPKRLVLVILNQHGSFLT